MTGCDGAAPITRLAPTKVITDSSIQAVTGEVFEFSPSYSTSL